jgi:hypothetical protein
MAAKKKRKARPTRQIARVNVNEALALRGELKMFLAAHNDDIARMNRYLHQLETAFQQNVRFVTEAQERLEKLTTLVEAIERPSVISRRLLAIKQAQHITQDIEGRLTQLEVNAREVRKDVDALRLAYQHDDDTEKLRTISEEQQHDEDPA